MNDAAATVVERAMNRSMNAPDEARLRVPPHSVEAEQSVLGGLLLEPQAIERIRDLLAESDFYRHENRLIFGAIEQVLRRGEPVDAVTVFEQLEGEPHEFGGLSYLTALSQSVPNASNIRRYAEIVAERAALRQIIATSDEIATAAFNTQGRTAADLLEQAGASIRHIGDSRKIRARRLPLVGLADLIERAEERPYLIKNLIPAQSLGVLFGGSGSFKSFIALDAGLHIAHGLPWLGRRTRQGAVVYVAAEGSDELGQRAQAWHRARRRKPEAPFHVVPAAIDLKAEAWRVVETVQAVGVTPALIVIDTMSQTFAGEENVAGDVAAYMRELGSRFRDLWQCAVLVIHHSGHTATERPRGSSAIQANTDYLYGVFRDEKEMLASLSCVHRKGGSAFDDAMFQLTREVLGKDSDGDEISSLVARHLTSAEEVQEAMEAEGKAGRGGHNQLFLRLAQNGMKESELRKVFGDEAGLENNEATRKAYWRARKWACTKGFIEIAQGYVMTLKKG